MRKYLECVRLAWGKGAFGPSFETDLTVLLKMRVFVWEL
jgi:hypothetical protein